MVEQQFIGPTLVGERKEKAIPGREDRMWKFTISGDFGFGIKFLTQAGLGLALGLGLPSK